MKQVYTFSTGEVYLDRLSSTKEGVEELIKEYLGESDYTVREVKFLDNVIEVNAYDIDLDYTRYFNYALVILTVS